MSMRPLALALFLMVSTACSSGPTVSLQTPEVAATALLKKVRHKKWGDIVFGQLTVTGMCGSLLKAHIDCFRLRIGDAVSSEPWIDSWVDYSREWTADDGKVNVAVYWPMKDFQAGTNADLVNAKLEIKERISGCFEFRP